MGLNITEKLIKSHLVSGEMTAGKEISIKIDQTLTQDSTGTMAYLQCEVVQPVGDAGKAGIFVDFHAERAVKDFFCIENIVDFFVLENASFAERLGRSAI